MHLGTNVHKLTARPAKRVSTAALTRDARRVPPGPVGRTARPRVSQPKLPLATGDGGRTLGVGDHETLKRLEALGRLRTELPPRSRRPDHTRTGAYRLSSVRVLPPCRAPRIANVAAVSASTPIWRRAFCRMRKRGVQSRSGRAVRTRLGRGCVRPSSPGIARRRQARRVDRERCPTQTPNPR